MTYPSLEIIISNLYQRLDEESNEVRKKLIEKWLSDLGKINQEMRNVEKLESFASAAIREQNEDE